VPVKDEVAKGSGHGILQGID